MLPEVGSTIVPPGLQLPLALGRLDHRQADPVLHRAARVQVLELREHLARRPRGESFVEADDRRRADELEEVGIVRGHAGSVCQPRAPRPFAQPPRSTARARRPRTSASAATTETAPMPAITQKPSAKPLVCALQRHRGPLASSVFVCVNATVAAIATPSAPPICCDVLISPDASPASCVLDAGERGDRHRDERERHADADQQVARQQVRSRSSPCTGICVYQSIPPVISASPVVMHGARRRSSSRAPARGRRRGSPFPPSKRNVRPVFSAE